jgi:hypothetical protein
MKQAQNWVKLIERAFDTSQTTKSAFDTSQTIKSTSDSPPPVPAPPVLFPSLMPPPVVAPSVTLPAVTPPPIPTPVDAGFIDHGLRLIVDCTYPIFRGRNTVQNTSVKKALKTLLRRFRVDGWHSSGSLFYRVSEWYPNTEIFTTINNHFQIEVSPIQVQSAIIPTCSSSDSKSELQLQENRSG